MSKKEFENLSKKEILIFQAVVDLINEGVDMAAVKVGEITAKAGIGKGTAYEYFTSKEEMVEKALQFATFRQVQDVKEMVEKADNFHDKFMCILNYMEANRDQIRTFLWMVRMSGNKINIITASMSGKACKNARDKFSEFVELASWFLAFADEEGLITQTNTDYRVSALISQIVQFGFYLHLGESDNLEDVKEFIYQGLIKQLN